MKEIWYWMMSPQAANMGQFLKGAGIMLFAISSWWLIWISDGDKRKSK